MSSPIGHTLAGISIFAGQSNISDRLLFRRLTACMFIANAPDLDFLPGLAVGMPNVYHHGVSHSLGAALVFSILAAVVLQGYLKYPVQRLFVLAFSLYVSHLLLDLLSLDGRPPFGIPLLWPLFGDFFTIPLLPPIVHSQLDSATIGQFLSDALSWQNLRTILMETTVGLVLFAFVRSGRKMAAFYRCKAVSLHAQIDIPDRHRRSL